MKVGLESPMILPPGPAPAERTEGEGDFAEAFTKALEKIEATTKSADGKAEGLVAGEVGIHEAMVAMEKADLSLKLATNIRNKLLDAYRQLSQVG